MKRKMMVVLGVLVLLSARASARDKFDEGLSWLYHLQYDKARSSFNEHIKSHPDDPAGYFYLTATNWWHLAQDIEYPLPEIRRGFESDVKDTIRVAKKLYETSEDPHVKARACLYWGGAEGLWGRQLVTQREWVKAYFAGKRGAKLLRKAVALDPELYDAYLGLGIYDYYTDTLSGVQKVLAAMLIRGDKERGLKRLHMALEKGSHSKVEAKCFFIEIYTSEEKTPEKALPLADSLVQQFPKSPAMHLLKISTLYSMKSWDAMLPEAEAFLQKASAEEPWFSKRYVLPARYCIAVAKLFGKNDVTAAEEELQVIIRDADPRSRWLGFARLRLGQIYDLRGERQKALEQYRASLHIIDLWGLHKEANDYIRQPYKRPKA